MFPRSSNFEPCRSRYSPHQSRYDDEYFNLDREKYFAGNEDYVPKVRADGTHLCFENPNETVARKVTLKKSEVLCRLDCRHFKPHEIETIVIDGKVRIEGNHGDLMDDHGLVSREFTRCIDIPEGFVQDEVSVTMDGNGILTVYVDKLVQTAINATKIKIQLV